ncbi:sigma-70 family RNA polymerase sigma factor (plasmid) [Paenibacillus cellulosilyticus]|uniref:sigma-70 family RNA polymerase sigma factor n=1 Tax=Paenibacillus cellulosilyticus TaxID=375489 RepID=UPI0015801AE9|nr:sigma-70 family RNA polymerase sigma factor [Paenibacillus cellulosilyticus]QKS48676.1 sigma-70 family RNA polymerase sigma factor [Paenibacillus cellulosilyticus]
MTDQQHIELVRKSSYGDREAFAEVVRTYSNFIYGVAFNMLGDFHLAQDIAQETFVKAWFKLDQLQEHDKFGSWIISIARRLCQDQLRGRKVVEMPIIEADTIADRSTLDDMVNRRSDAEAVRKALASLDDKYRTTTWLYYISGLNTREISRLLDIPVGTIDSRLRRAKQILRTELIELVEHTAQSNKLGEPFVNKVRARIKNALQVRLVSDLDKAKEYYTNVLGFTIDDWGHTEREGVGFILQQAEKPEHVRPNAKPSPMTYPADWSGPPTAWDTYAYSDFNGVQSLYEEFRDKGAIIAYDPIVEDMGSMQWREFAVRDLDGYVIVFGGGS